MNSRLKLLKLLKLKKAAQDVEAPDHDGSEPSFVPDVESSLPSVISLHAHHSKHPSMMDMLESSDAATRLLGQRMIHKAYKDAVQTIREDRHGRGLLYASSLLRRWWAIPPNLSWRMLILADGEANGESGPTHILILREVWTAALYEVPVTIGGGIGKWLTSINGARLGGLKQGARNVAEGGSLRLSEDARRSFFSQPTTCLGCGLTGKPCRNWYRVHGSGDGRDCRYTKKNHVVMPDF